MKRMIAGLQNIFRAIVHPPAHPAAEQVMRAAERQERASLEVNRQSDAFSDMIRGMRGESRPRSKRGKKK